MLRIDQIQLDGLSAKTSLIEGGEQIMETPEQTNTKSQRKTRIDLNAHIRREVEEQKRIQARQLQASRMMIAATISAVTIAAAGTLIFAFVNEKTSSPFFKVLLSTDSETNSIRILIAITTLVIFSGVLFLDI